jgi:Prolyl oligopeptidase, N-terminal beta-propeller domain.
MTELPLVRAARIPMTDTYHGVDVSEDYRWLEDASFKETIAWTKAQQSAPVPTSTGSPGGTRCGPVSSSC